MTLHDTQSAASDLLGSGSDLLGWDKQRLTTVFSRKKHSGFPDDSLASKVSELVALYQGKLLGNPRHLWRAQRTG